MYMYINVYMYMDVHMKYIYILCMCIIGIHKTHVTAYVLCVYMKHTYLYVYVLNTYNTYILIQYTCTLSGKNVKALLFVNINISDFNKIHACVDPGKTGKHFGFAGEEVNRGLG